MHLALYPISEGPLGVSPSTIMHRCSVSHHKHLWILVLGLTPSGYRENVLWRQYFQENEKFLLSSIYFLNTRFCRVIHFTVDSPSSTTGIWVADVSSCRYCVAPTTIVSLPRDALLAGVAKTLCWGSFIVNRTEGTPWGVKFDSNSSILNFETAIYGSNHLSQQLNLDKRRWCQCLADTPYIEMVPMLNIIIYTAQMSDGLILAKLLIFQRPGTRLKSNVQYVE